MKYLKTFLIACLLGLIPSITFAAWTVTVTRYEHQRSDGPEITEFAFSCESDASASGDQSLETLLKTAYPTRYREYMNDIKGSILWWVKYKPGTGSEAPASESTIKIDDEGYVSAVAGLAFNEIVTSGTTAESWPGNIDTDNIFMPITDLYFSMTTLGNGDTATLSVWLMKLR